MSLSITRQEVEQQFAECTEPVECTSHHREKCLFLNPISKCQTEVVVELCRDAGCVWERGPAVKVGHGRS